MRTGELLVSTATDTHKNVAAGKYSWRGMMTQSPSVMSVIAWTVLLLVSAAAVIAGPHDVSGNDVTEVASTGDSSSIRG